MIRWTTLLSALLISTFHEVRGQCPTTVQLPCSCATTRYEPVQITCDNAGSLANALRSIGRPTSIIDSLIIANTPIDHLPAFAFQGYNVKRLVLRNNRLSSIDVSSFDGPMRSSLEELEIRNNLLSDVPQVGVPNLRGLKTLILSKNRIQTLQPRAFDNYESKAALRKLDFSSNLLQAIDAEAFAGGLTCIQEINFDKNFLTDVPTDALRGLVSLEDLSLAVNQLQQLNPGSLTFANLKSLSLEVNRIAYIDPTVFAGTPNLLYLYLSANNFSALAPDMLKNVPKLKVLAMGNNPIAQLTAQTFQYVPEMVRLEMSECQISRIEPGVFQATPKLQVIVLNKNSLKQIEKSTFQNLKELYSVDLKANFVSFVADGAFAQLPSLQHLDISSNKLQTFSPGTFVGTFERNSPPKTRVLYIYENPWTCDQQLEWFRRWLRDNMDIMIDAPGHSPTVCWKPEWLLNWPIRSQNQPSPSGQPTTWMPPITKDDGGKFVTDMLLDGQNDDVADTRMSAVNLTAMTLGIILGVFLLTLLLLMIVRYFVSKNRRDMKERDDDQRRLGSSMLSSYQPSVNGGAAYPSPALGDDSPSVPPARPKTGYFLNRPWYWWF